MNFKFQILLANFLAQTEALMNGKDLNQVNYELKGSDSKIAQHKVSIFKNASYIF